MSKKDIEYTELQPYLKKLEATLHSIPLEDHIESDNASMKFLPASQYLSKRYRYITTGIEKLDQLLDGGIRTQAITEFYGGYGAGKTQLCFQLSVTTQLPEESGGLDSKVIYIDTEDTFSSKRIVQIANRFNIDPETAVNNILVGKSTSLKEYIDMIAMLDRVVSQHSPVGLIVVDSFVAPLRGELIGLHVLNLRQNILNAILTILRKIAVKYDLAVVVTNQVVASPKPLPFLPDEAPVGGHILAHASTYRLELSTPRTRFDRGIRLIKMVDSPEHPPFQIPIVIRDDGVHYAKKNPDKG